jgi:type IV pilus assembly protein PilV
VSRSTNAMAKTSMSHEKGFTLIEVIIAIFLLAVALLGLATVTMTVIKGNTLSQTVTTATTLARDKMEELKGMNYDALPTLTVTDYATAEGTLQTSAADSYYKREWSSPGTDTKTIQVRVTWQEQSHSVELKTIRTRD